MLKNRFQTPGAHLPRGYDRSQYTYGFTLFGRKFELVALTKGGQVVSDQVLLMETNQQRQWASASVDLKAVAYHSETTAQLSQVHGLADVPGYLKAVANRLGMTDVFNMLQGIKHFNAAIEGGF